MSNEPISQQWYEASLRWVDLEAAASLLEDTKSAILAQMMLKCGDVPVSKAEMKVKSSPEWEDHIKKMVKARTEANKARVFAEFLKMRAFEEQSSQATERVTARL